MPNEDTMIQHFRHLLEEGKVPSDPFQDVIDELTGPTEAQKEAMIRSWNNRIALACGGEQKLMKRVHARRARRARHS